MQATSKISDTIRKYLGAYASKDRQVVEDLLADDFTFTSPHDNHIDRKAYFERYWQKDQKLNGDEAYIFKFNSGDKIQALEVYYGQDEENE